MNALAWILTPFFAIYMLIRIVVFGIIEFFIPNTKGNTQEIVRKQMSRAVENANASNKEMTDKRFHEINSFMCWGMAKNIPPQVLAQMMFDELHVTATESDEMKIRLQSMSEAELQACVAKYKKELS